MDAHIDHFAGKIKKNFYFILNVYAIYFKYTSTLFYIFCHKTPIGKKFSLRLFLSLFYAFRAIYKIMH